MLPFAYRCPLVQHGFKTAKSPITEKLGAFRFGT